MKIAKTDAWRPLALALLASVVFTMGRQEGPASSAEWGLFCIIIGIACGWIQDIED